ncbi:MAG: endonuclease/exonuclease/phosphatase family protein [Acidobacteriota bacterium]|nr:MAG: endonuclease/exonuclease/phosphatase family protein [Acidobacteriota bacterium]
MKRLLVLIGLLFSAGVVFADDPPQLRVLTYNIHHGEGLDGKFDYERLARVIADLNPDLVALQEVDRKTDRAAGVDQADLLGELTGMKVAYGRAMYYGGGEYGQTVLSRFPILESKTHPLPFRSGYEPRAAQAAVIRPDNGLPDLLLINTHLCHRDEEIRVEQIQHMIDLFAEEKSHPVILAGDLNARPGSPSIDLVTTKWENTLGEQARIDYVLVRPRDGWKVVEVKIVDERVVSDHKPVLVTLEWNRQ